MIAVMAGAQALFLVSRSQKMALRPRLLMAQ